VQVNGALGMELARIRAGELRIEAAQAGLASTARRRGAHVPRWRIALGRRIVGAGRRVMRPATVRVR
jgi:hypothetical protein